jgi:non-canonical purine NTP pyrophosphatase (RdgB/HAM1 family)
MILYFITGNKNKFREAKEIIPEIEQIDFDLLEIQEIDSKKIIENKLNEALKQNPGEMFFCEDVSLNINCLNGLPGPLIKWFLKSLGTEGIYKLVKKYEDKLATAKVTIGYSNANKKLIFFSGEIKGEIVKPRGEKNFGWDPIFQPKGYDKTFAEMSLDEKNKISMRKEALLKLKSYLEKYENELRFNKRI